MSRTSLFLTLALAVFLAASFSATGISAAAADPSLRDPGHRASAAESMIDKSQVDSAGYADIDNVKLYYEISGAGPALLYLHGGLSSSRDFDKYRPAFSKRFRVITVDRRGHGRSYDSDESYSYSSMAKDMNLFLDYLKIDSAFVIGWSDGGDVGYYLAGKYPSRVKKLVAVGANYRVAGLTASTIDWITGQLTVEGVAKSFPKVEEDYKKYNPRPDNYRRFIENTRTMWLRDPYIPKEEFMKISIPVLLVAGDQDAVRLDHMIEMHSLLKNSQLCILPGRDHFVFDSYSDIVANIILGFLNR